MNIKSFYRGILTNKKSILRACIVSLFLRSHTKIVIASVGRSGSSVLTRQIADAYFLKYLPKYLHPFRSLLVPFMWEFCNYLDQVSFFSGPIIKTHDQYSALLMMDFPVKFIFIYCDPLESALSVSRQRYFEGDKWVALHIDHLRGKGSPEHIFYRDALNFENQILAWLESPALFIKYPDFWKQHDRISNFLNIDVKLPIYKERVFDDSLLPVDYNFQMFEDLRRLLNCLE